MLVKRHRVFAPLVGLEGAVMNVSLQDIDTAASGVGRIYDQLLHWTNAAMMALCNDVTFLVRNVHVLCFHFCAIENTSIDYYLIIASKNVLQ